jgi:hypothetical protein
VSGRRDSQRQPRGDLRRSVGQRLTAAHLAWFQQTPGRVSATGAPTGRGSARGRRDSQARYPSMPSYGGSVRACAARIAT